MKFPWVVPNTARLLAATVALNVLPNTCSTILPFDPLPAHPLPRSQGHDSRQGGPVYQRDQSPLPKQQGRAPPLTSSRPVTPAAKQHPATTTGKPRKQEVHPLPPKPLNPTRKQAANHTEKAWTKPATHASYPPRLSVLTTSGRYLGFTNQSRHSVDTWLGVRYAKPPLEDLRFRAPVLLDKNQEDEGKMQLAFDFGDACPQSPFDPPLDPEVDISEDCLYLNVYRPSSADSKSLLPVLVWIHGGGYTYGTGAATDGAVLVSSSYDSNKPILFVSMNYRLNSFGFLNTDDLPREDLQVGLKDQITCLKWLKLNIQAFGGDPDKITIWGQSAGALSVATLVTYLYDTSAATLFRSAIMDSGSPTSHTVPEVNVYDRPGMPYALLLQLTGCDAPKTSPKSGSTTSDQLECLRNLEYTVLLKATLKIQGTLPFSRQISIWGPSYKSGSLIDRRPSERLASGHFLKIPMLIGTNKDEGTRSLVGPSLSYSSTSEGSDAFFYSYMTNSSVLDLEQVDSEVYNKVAQLYPDEPSLGSPFGTGNKTFGLPKIFKRLAAWYGDLHYQAPRRLWARKASPYSPVYVYYFDGPPASNEEPHDGVSHSSELPLIFGNINEEDLPLLEIKETRALAEKVRDRYISFVYELNPGDDWPAYTPRTNRVMRFNKKVIQGELIQDDWRTEQLNYLNSRPALDTYLT